MTSAANIRLVTAAQTDGAREFGVLHHVLGPVVATGAVTRLTLHPVQAVFGRGRMAGDASRVALLGRVEALKRARMGSLSPVVVLGGVARFASTRADVIAGTRRCGPNRADGAAKGNNSEPAAHGERIYQRPAGCETSTPLSGGCSSLYAGPNEDENSEQRG